LSSAKTERPCLAGIETIGVVVKKTFVGIGFGPIQSGLFLYVAQASGNFERLVVAEVVPDVVAAARSRGCVWINVAGREKIHSHPIENVEALNPCDSADVPRLIDAIAHADELATALPSVDSYCRGNPSPAELLARGFTRKCMDQHLPRAIVYTAENDRFAAEKLHDAVIAAIDPAYHTLVGERAQFINTVIGKMSGMVTDPVQIERDGLMPFVPGGKDAVLVEQFNRILINEISLAGFERGITTFEEKPVLGPFEEAKLYGHNAAHALLGYLANVEHLTFVHEVIGTELLDFVEAAFLDESGTALCHRHAGIDPLFTPDGWAQYVHDLLERMTNPQLRDRVDRVIRDPARKLGWDDRLIGTMRLAIENNICPRRYALGAAAAVDLLADTQSTCDVADVLNSVWGASNDARNGRDVIIECIEQARSTLRSKRSREWPA
jgi:mannitol-1-phosphate 5-dehydrogenase